MSRKNNSKQKAQSKVTHLQIKDVEKVVQVQKAPRGVCYFELSNKSPDLKRLKTFQSSTMIKIRTDLSGSKGLIIMNYTPFFTNMKPQELISEGSELRRREVVFLCEVVYEWVRRIFFHYPDEEITDADVVEQANNCNEAMKIDKFETNTKWLRRFKDTYLTTTMSEQDLYNTKVQPQKSLDILDIMSYCHQYPRLSFAELEERETVVRKSLWEYVQRIKLNYNGRFPSYQSILLVAKQLCLFVDIDEALINRDWLGHFYKEFQIQISATNLKVDFCKDELQEIVYIFRPPVEEDVKPMLFNEDSQEGEEHILPTNDANNSTVKSENSFDYVDKCFADLIYEESDADLVAEPLPKRVRTNADALKLLKPLEDYAELQSNQRAINLLTQLTNIFKK